MHVINIHYNLIEKNQSMKLIMFVPYVEGRKKLKLLLPAKNVHICGSVGWNDQIEKN